MAGFEDGKLGLRSTANNHRRRFFDGKHHRNDGAEINEEDTSIKVSKNEKKKNGKKIEDVVEDVNSKKAAEKVLINALKEEFTKKIERLGIKNAKGKDLLNVEVSGIVSLVGKDILEDEFIIHDIGDTIKQGEEVVLQDAYRNRIVDLIDKLSVSKINELLFDFYVDDEIGREIAKLKNTVDEGAIYQGIAKEISGSAIIDLKKKISKEIERISFVKNHYLHLKEKNLKYAIKGDDKDEISELIHRTVREELIIDEIPVALNIAKNKMENENSEIKISLQEDVAPINEPGEKLAASVQNQKIEVVADESQIEDGKDQVKNETVAVQEENIEQKKKVEELIEDCNKKGRTLKEKYGELRSHVVTDEERIDVIRFNNEYIVPVARKIKELLVKDNKAKVDAGQLIKELKESQAELDMVLQLTEEMITKHEVLADETKIMEDALVEKDDKPKFERETIETAVELAQEFKVEFLKEVEGKDVWEKRGKYKEESLRLEIKIFLNALIDQEKIVEENDKDDFIESVLTEVFSAKEDKESETKEDSFNQLLKSVKI